MYYYLHFTDEKKRSLENLNIVLKAFILQVKNLEF